MNKSSPGFRRRKFALALRIAGAGIGIALLWDLWSGFVLHEKYPYDTILSNPASRYSDFTDETLAAVLPNPYIDPISVYPPAAFLFFRTLAFSDDLSLILVFFYSLVFLALLLQRILQPVIPNPLARVPLTFLSLALCYPLLFCLDRGNLEIVMAPLIGWALYFYSRHRDLAGTACLFPAICLKIYPALLLILLLRRRKAGLACACGLAALAVTVVSAACFPVPASEIWSAYQQNLHFFRDYYVLDNSTIEGSASPWNTYKLVLVGLHQFGLIPIINFSFDGGFIGASYVIYSAAMALFALTCVGYACLHERNPPRGILILLLFLSIAAPNGADYRLIYASMGLALLTVLPQRRTGDWAALILIALAVIPKKEIILNFVGITETTYPDVPIQALLNPLFILTTMAILIYHSPPFDRQQAARRLRDLLPSRWRWT